MAGTFLGKYDTTAANNTATGTNSVSVAEGMLPSNINNAFRSVMADIRQHYNAAEWIEYGDGAGTYTATYASGTSFTIDGTDVTSIYHAGRRVKVVASTPGTIYGTVSSTSFSTNTTVNVTWDSGSLSNEAITSVHIGVLAKTNSSIPTGVIAAGNIADGAISTAKLAADAVTGAKIADDAIDSEHYTDGSIDTAHIADSQVTTAKIADTAITTAKITDANVTTAKIAADAITGAKIADDAINSEHYTDGSIDTAHIADSQITAAKIGSNAVTTAKINADAVTNAKIADDSIDSEHYVDGSIDTAHIADANVTLAKLATGSVNSAKIVDDSIVNADINSSAAIAATKIHDGTISNTEFGYLNGVSSAIQTQIDTKAATTYVDNAVAGLRTRIIAEAATTANVDLSADLQNGDTIDGVTLVTGDRVLVKDQSTASQNGLYTVVSSGTASRDTQFNTIDELSGQMIVVNQGTANDNKIFLCTTNNTATLDSDSITYNVITPSNVGTVTSIGIADAGAGEITVSNTPITSNGNITLAINSIADTKLGTISTANKVSLTALNIDGGSDIGADLTTSDLIIVDDGAGGTNKKAALSRVVTLMTAQGFVTDDPTALAIALG
nr:hypothetical protein [uncultured Mediterranean phage uvMED]